MQCAIERERVTVDASLHILLTWPKKKRKRKKRYVWIKPWLPRRHIFVAYENLRNDLAWEDVNFINFPRINFEIFKDLKRRVGPRSGKKKTYPFLRKTLELALKLAITLRYLATGKLLKPATCI